MSKRAAVLGLGSSGKAAAELLCHRGWSVTVLDSSSSLATFNGKIKSLNKDNISVITGSAANTDPSPYDLCVISPGIDLATPIVQNVLYKKVPLIGEVELAFRECSIPIIAVTGTNGKTTTTGLIETLLNGCGLRARACGNIGLPFSAVVLQPSDLQILVAEISSFQLETIHRFRPHIALWLNLSPNHLDRYHSLEEYRQAKLRIFLNQTNEDFVVANARERLPRLAAKQVTFSTCRKIKADFSQDGSQILFQGSPILDQNETHLPGVHNAENLMAALGAGHCLGLDFPEMAQAISRYLPLAHRCELVEERKGVRWINDSKSTNLASLEKAIESQTGPIILIAGGKDKGFEFDDIAPLVTKRVKAAIIIGEMRQRIAASWHTISPKICDSLEDAVLLANSLSKSGDTVLFSPGTSSYDMFVNYEDRGNQFKHLVHSLPK